MGFERRRTRRRWFPRLLWFVFLFLVLAPVALLLPLRWVPPPATAFMLRYGFEHGGYDFRWTPLEKVSPCLPAAVIAAEDQKFPRHFGFDLESIRDAVAARQRRLRGASTISQQTVKNLYLWPGRSFVRKGLEAWLTVYLELLWPKARILEVYVNIAEFGPGIYGARAASLHFFGKEPATLSEQEAALLAAVLPSPTRLSPAPASPRVLERAGWIRGQMRNAAGCRPALDAPSGLTRLATALRHWLQSLRAGSETRQSGTVPIGVPKRYNARSDLSGHA